MKKASDANKQSAYTFKRCQYRCKWQKTGTVTRAPETTVSPFIRCSVCGLEPTAKQQREAENIIELREMLKPGDTVYTVLRYVSRSGMMRGIDLYLIRDNQPVWITSRVGHAIGSPQTGKDWRESRGLRVSGCGMDMGFHLVYTLSRVLFPDGVPDSKSEHKRTDGGYALEHRWL